MGGLLVHFCGHCMPAACALWSPSPERQLNFLTTDIFGNIYRQHILAILLPMLLASHISSPYFTLQRRQCALWSLSKATSVFDDGHIGNSHRHLILASFSRASYIFEFSYLYFTNMHYVLCEEFSSSLCAEEAILCLLFSEQL